MMDKILGLVYSIRTMAVTLVLFVLAMAVATFIENDYGTAAAKALVYNAKWFEFLMFLLVINFAGNIFRYKLYRWANWPVFLLHLAFVVILLGAFITRYFSFEGLMPIREGTETSIIYSDKTYVTAIVDNKEVMRTYETEVLFNQLGGNNYKLKEIFGDQEGEKTPFEISFADYIPRAKESLIEDPDGEYYIHIVVSEHGSMEDIYLKSGEVKYIMDIPFGFNHLVEGGMNFFEEEGMLSFRPSENGTVMEMVDQEAMPIKQDSTVALAVKHLYSFEVVKFVIPEIVKGKLGVATAPLDEQEMYPYDAVILKINSGTEEKEVVVSGMKGTVAPPEVVSVNGLNFVLSYGSKKIETPFSVYLRDFELEHYPGTNSASSYASEITVKDTEKTFDYRIYMNHVLDYKGYRFFQASYDQDEQGTILSVNHDYWGTLVTYIGYFLMGLGMFISLFWKHTRFSAISEKLKNISMRKISTVLLILLFAVPGISQNDPSDFSDVIVGEAHAQKFGKLLIQDHQGRIKPINTFALEALRKVYKKDNFHGQSAEQVLLSAHLNPVFWSSQDIIKVKQHAIGEKLCQELNIQGEFAPLVNFFKNGNYVLEDQVAKSIRKKKSQRNATDNELINLDERINIWINILQGKLLTIYPKIGDPKDEWYTGLNHEVFSGADTAVLMMHELYMTSLVKAVETGDYSESDDLLGLIEISQKEANPEIIPSDTKVEMEVKYNQWSIFKKLMFYYMAVGFIFLILAFVDLISPGKRIINIALKIFTALTVVGMLAHLYGIGARWYISEHAPWSNGYEAVIFVAFVTTLAGLIFSYKKSKFSLASTVLFASFLLGIAHGSLMNPEITNLVPVLKSYWLMIHVAIITASYGFLGLGALLGFIVLVLYILRTPKNAERFNEAIKELTLVNESTLTVGLYTLSLGTFLGGVWANESWGRYWSWDPKEVWSLISMMVYVFVLHMRLIPGLKGEFAFNLASLISIGTLIMTFFGVNYYLSGMHSYAGGDPVPIPNWIYISVVFFTLLSIFAYWRNKTFKEIDNPDLASSA